MNNNTITNNDPLINLANSSILSLPTPTSISYLWNIGFLLSVTLIMQIISGVTLSINYVAHTESAFDSVLHIIRDIDIGWTMRYLHINGASLFFILLYGHLARGIYFNSPINLPIVWVSGVILLLISIATSFLGYVLPWGQISFWGATVITSIISAIPYVGNTTTQWLWGNFSVSQPTLNRFFSLHFLLPLIIVAIIIVHLIILHQNGSSNPVGVNPDYDNINFFPYFIVNDTVPLIIIIISIFILLAMAPNSLGDVENFNIASATTTPNHIQPEWYFLFAYAILRSIPSNLGGVVAIVMSILILLVLCINSPKINNNFQILNNIQFWSWVWISVLLTWIGANPVEPPYTSMGAWLTLLYFSAFILLSSYSLHEQNFFKV